MQHEDYLKAAPLFAELERIKIVMKAINQFSATLIEDDVSTLMIHNKHCGTVKIDEIDANLLKAVIGLIMVEYDRTYDELMTDLLEI